MKEGKISRKSDRMENVMAKKSAKKALEQAPKLRGLEAHSSVILSRVDEQVFKKLGVNITFEPKYQTKKLYHA